MMIAAVGLAAYCLLDVALSALVAIAWRSRAIAPINLPPATRAHRLFILRMLPAVTATLVTLAIVLPAFITNEPVQSSEPIGPALVVLAVAALTQLAAGVSSAAWRAALTFRIERQLRRRTLRVSDHDTLETVVVDSPQPFAALVGVFSPRLIASASIIDACDEAEVGAIVAHERGHLQARDNLRRWLMSTVPDMLRWTPIDREIVDAWHHAAEDAADDAATGSDPRARANLAALLLKVVRLAPRSEWSSAIVSPFVEDDHGLERRVRRLLKDEREEPAPLALMPLAAMGVIVVASLGILASPAALEIIFDVFEGIVAFGR
jgi:Zn-dependent protease with chaperone function